MAPVNVGGFMPDLVVLIVTIALVGGVSLLLNLFARFIAKSQAWLSSSLGERDPPVLSLLNHLVASKL